MKTNRAITEKLTDQCRRLVAECGQTRYRIAQATGISEATLCRFASGERFLSPKALDTLGEYLGWRIVVNSGRTNKKGR